MCKSFEGHYAAEVYIHVYIGIDVSKKDRENELYHKNPGCDKRNDKENITAHRNLN